MSHGEQALARSGAGRLGSTPTTAGVAGCPLSRPVPGRRCRAAWWLALLLGVAPLAWAEELAVDAGGAEVAQSEPVRPVPAPLDPPALASPSHPIAPRRPDGLPITALSWGVADVATGQILYGHELLTRRFPASTTKLMTTLLCLEALESGRITLDTTVRVSKAASEVVESGLWLAEGEPITVHDLMVGIMVRSANDAAYAMAEVVGGTVDGFVAMMNDRARRLGCVETHFVNPHGLHMGAHGEPTGDQHYTTGYDLLKITLACWRYPFFRELCTMNGVKVSWAPPPPEVVARQAAANPKAPSAEPRANVRVIHNRNKLLSRYAECLGVKTGYTRQAGACLVSAAGRGGREVIAVTLHSASGLDRWIESEAILRAGLDDFEPVEVVRAGQRLGEARVMGGVTTTLPLVAAEGLTMLQHRLEPVPTWSLDNVPAVPAPVLAGLPLGMARVSDPQRPGRPVAVLAAADVPVPGSPLAGWRIGWLVALGGLGLVCYGAFAEADRRRG